MLMIDDEKKFWFGELHQPFYIWLTVDFRSIKGDWYEGSTWISPYSMLRCQPWLAILFGIGMVLPSKSH